MGPILSKVKLLALGWAKLRPCGHILGPSCGAPGRCLRDPTEKKYRPRWQVPEAQFQGCSPQAARSRGSLPRLPPDAGKAAVQGYQRRCGGFEGAWTLPSGPYRKEVQAEVLTQARLRCRTRQRSHGETLWICLASATVSPCGVPGAAPPRRQLGQGRRICIQYIYILSYLSYTTFQFSVGLERSKPTSCFR